MPFLPDLVRSSSVTSIKASTMDNHYTGFRVSAQWSVERISATISPEEFFSKYIAPRKPVILTSHIRDTEWKASLWSNEYLKKKAGTSKIKVEKKDKNGNYGTGQEKLVMTFGELLDKLRAGCNDLYLTTQYDDDSHTQKQTRERAVLDYCPPPLTNLLGDFPLRPKILGNLVPQQVNVWMGNSKDGSSSGLHHDYHDNLYILLRGKKRFTLFSPGDAERMYTYGKQCHVHPNGLINYGNRSTRADGACGAELAKYRVKKEEDKLAKLTEEGAAEEDIQAAEERLEEALDELLAAEAGFEDEDSEPEVEANAAEADGEPEKDEDEPPSFSRIDTATLHSPTPSMKFPLLQEAIRVVCEIQEGEMLYLPASWYHEVTSFTLPEADDFAVLRREPGHMAFNYWMHPPTTAEYTAPYEDDFWARRWKKLEQVLLDKANKKSAAKPVGGVLAKKDFQKKGSALATKPNKNRATNKRREPNDYGGEKKPKKKRNLMRVRT
jgi:ribosomal protein L16 Arg81 hydroxylase